MEEGYFESKSERKLCLEKNIREMKIFENYIKNSDTQFARKIKTCFKNTREFLRQYAHTDKSLYSKDVMYSYYKFIMESIKFLNTYMTEEEWVSFCDRFTELGINNLFLPDKFPQKNKESDVITINNITSSNSWKLYYFYTSPDYISEEPELKAFLLRSCPLLTDMFDVSKTVHDLINGEIIYSDFLLAINKKMTTYECSKRQISKINPCIVCGREEKNPYNKSKLCFYCWVIYEYINANIGLKLNSIQKFVKKCKEEFGEPKSELRRYFEDKIYKCRRNPKFPLPEDNISYCLNKMFEK